jgi:SAM-dependent methyltransferase
MAATEDRLAREQAFHDARFGSEHRPADRFYAINRASDRFFRAAIGAIAPWSCVLDYGCGDGAYAAIEAASHGCLVTAIDISPVAIESARARAEAHGVADRIDFCVMNAEALEFDADSFDFVCGLGVIHHLDIERSLAEVSRVLKPQGRALFVEPLGHNPLINAYRRRTPAQRTVDEHPLLASDMEAFGRRFREVRESYFHLLDLAALPLAGRPGFDQTLSALDRLDARLLRTPLRRHAWMVGLELAGPRPAALAAAGGER